MWSLSMATGILRLKNEYKKNKSCRPSGCAVLYGRAERRTVAARAPCYRWGLYPLLSAHPPSVRGGEDHDR